MEVIIDDDLIEKLKERIGSKQKSINLYINDLLKKELNLKEDLGSGFYFNNNIKRVYDTSNNEVPLTKIQLSILAYLIKNRNTFISTKELMKSCWTEDKNPSIFSLRNQIKHMLILL